MIPFGFRISTFEFPAPERAYFFFATFFFAGLDFLIIFDLEPQQLPHLAMVILLV